MKSIENFDYRILCQWLSMYRDPTLVSVNNTTVKETIFIEMNAKNSKHRVLYYECDENDSDSERINAKIKMRSIVIVVFLLRCLWSAGPLGHYDLIDFQNGHGCSRRVLQAPILVGVEVQDSLLDRIARGIFGLYVDAGTFLPRLEKSCTNNNSLLLF